MMAEKKSRVIELMRQGKHAEAEASLRERLGEESGDVEARNYLAYITARDGR